MKSHVKWNAAINSLLLLLLLLLNHTIYLQNTSCSVHSCFSDIMSIYKEPPPGMCVVADSEDVTKVL